MLRHFSRNDNGRDFAVGDIHGCFSLVEDTLSQLAFDHETDRLFSVGDLVDRGPDSAAALAWLTKPWFHPVRGNHEQMAIDAAAGRYNPVVYRANGGAWFLQLPQSDRRVFADAFENLPYAMEIETNEGLIGMVHADIPTPDWAELRDLLRLPDAQQRFPRITESVMWSRERIRAADQSVIPDLRALVVGHTPVRGQPVTLGNVVYIDTGAVFPGGRLTIIELGRLPAPRR